MAELNWSAEALAWLEEIHGYIRIARLHRADDGSVFLVGVFHGALDIDRYLP